MDGKLYVGGANKNALLHHCRHRKDPVADRATDWIRAKPAMTSQGLLVATVDGKLSCVDGAGDLKWSKQISTHPIYADLVSAGDTVLLNDSDLWLRRINASGDVLWKRSLLSSFRE